MPVSLATEKLAALISRFPEIPPVRADAAKIAARLTALLPGTVHSKIPVPRLSVRALQPTMQILMAPRFLFFLMSITLGVMLAAELVIAPVHATDPIKSDRQTVTHPSYDGTGTYKAEN
jgi:hypothetical protein